MVRNILGVHFYVFLRLCHNAENSKVSVSIFSHQTRLGFKYYTMVAVLAVTKNLKKVVATKKGKFGHNSEVSLRNIILLFACEFFSLAWICFYTILSPWEKICFLCKEFWKAPSRTGKNNHDDAFLKYLPNVMIVLFLILFWCCFNFFG